MSATTAAAIIAAIAATASAVQSSSAAAAARKAEKKNTALTRAAEAYRNAKAARIAVAEARLKRSQSLALGEAQGVTDSSSVIAAAANPGNQVAGQIGLAQVQESAAYGITNNNAIAAKKIGKYQDRAAAFGVVASVAGMYASMGNAPTTNQTYMGPTTPAGPGISNSTPPFAPVGINSPAPTWTGYNSFSSYRFMGR